MVIVMKHGVGPERIQALVSQLEREHGVAVGITNGVGCSILGLVGDRKSTRLNSSHQQ